MMILNEVTTPGESTSKDLFFGKQIWMFRSVLRVFQKFSLRNYFLSKEDFALTNEDLKIDAFELNEFLYTHGNCLD